jgi:hypothetical protein
MAAAAVASLPAMPKAMFRPIIENKPLSRKPVSFDFDPKEHLAYEKPESIVMMKDIGYKEDTGVSPVAVSQPFRLFSTEAVQRFRDEVLSEEVLTNCFQKSNIAACQIRGMAPK